MGGVVGGLGRVGARCGGMFMLSGVGRGGGVVAGQEEVNHSVSSFTEVCVITA